MLKKVLYKKKKFAILKKVATIVLSVIAVLLAIDSILRDITKNESNIITLAIEIAEEYFPVNFKKTIEIPVSEDDPYGIKTQCKQNGYTPDIPFYLPKGFELKEMSHSNDCNEVDNRFTEHQSKWPEVLLNIDAYNKCIYKYKQQEKFYKTGSCSDIKQDYIIINNEIIPKINPIKSL